MQENIANPAGSRRHRVLLVEDQTAIRQMLAAALECTEDFEVIGEAEDVEQALKLARQLEPNVVVLDWLFPGGGGATFLRAIQAERLHCNVLVMSASTEEEAVREALMSGAKGYVEKTANLEELMAALRAVAVGGAFFGPLVAGVVENLVKKAARPRTRSAPARVAAETPGSPAEVDPAAATLAAPPVVPATVN
ncbi:MAG: response regulator transcription factor [Verrucomicrobia bacterium]|nr:response regulator transcription factor [Verrucomicrobiota bacterium]